MKLFPKLALLVSALFLGAIAALGSLYYWTERRQIQEEVHAEQQKLLLNLVHISQESFLTGDDLLLIKYTRWLQKWNPTLVSASVTNAEGQVLAHSEPKQIGQTLPKGHPTVDVVMSQAVQMGSQTVATASIAFSQAMLDEAFNARVAQLRRRAMKVVAIVLLLAVGASFLVALSWTRPIKRVVRETEEIGKGNWNINLAELEQRPDELGVLSRAVHAMAAQLAELDDMKEDFVSSVTHELRSPLGAIESFLNMIAHERKNGALTFESLDIYHERMRVNVTRLARFVNDLLDVAAIDRGKMVAHSQNVDLRVLASDCLSLFEVILKQKQIHAAVEAPSECPLGLADPDKVHQVLVNLLSNAIKFTPEGGMIRVRVELLSDKELKVSVTDSGVGISDADQKKIFNKFEQVTSARAKVKGPKGTGLGLAICKGLVELQGGSLAVQSTPGVGSTFSFTVPMAPLPLAS
jgi:signal transduction histidine kinase